MMCDKRCHSTDVGHEAMLEQVEIDRNCSSLLLEQKKIGNLMITKIISGTLDFDLHLTYNNGYKNSKNILYTNRNFYK